ncbi:vesicle-associated protein 2-1-like [Spinacia oleracea]|uniref:Vesicle-associated protein 2-1-like n=1 Tax=Spinacia oleracea TaxID=3562 RepID=A0ABM3R148_SPIOL|nr:vesicle-associated protein 2-1-like [Spinacia oleracea]
MIVNCVVGSNQIVTMKRIKRLISVLPEELKFSIELKKQSYCDMKVTNRTDQNVAFKVKTTSPKKYRVSPNAGIIRPRGSCVIRVTVQAQQEYPPNMECKDKFLLQSTIVPPNSKLDDLSPEIFNKGGGRIVQECKLDVVYVSANSDQNQELQRVKKERDAAIQEKQKLQQELALQRQNPQPRLNSGTHKIHAQYKHWTIFCVRISWARSSTRSR